MAMSEREPDPRAARLIGELFPCPEPPADLTARVLQAVQEDAARAPTPAPRLAIVERVPALEPSPRPLPPRPEYPRSHRFGRVPLLAAVLGAAAALVIATASWVAARLERD